MAMPSSQSGTKARRYKNALIGCFDLRRDTQSGKHGDDGANGGNDQQHIGIYEVNAIGDSKGAAHKV